jgi:azurin
MKSFPPNPYHTLTATRQSVLRATIVLFFSLLLPHTSLAKDVTIQIATAPGLKFDTPRFAVQPGDVVTLTLTNPDLMMHNLVVTTPGDRMTVVNAALALGQNGPAKNYVPDIPQVIAATPVIAPNGATTLTFTASQTPGVYPFVCTYPGHGFLMFGAIYVGTPMPPLEEDLNVPDSARGLATASALHPYPDTRPVVDRIYMPDSGPASIAVGMEGDHSYVFDAGACRLRYAWTGGYIDAAPQFEAAGSLFANIVGRVYWRDTLTTAPIRFNSPTNEATSKFLGYKLTDGLPTFRYTLDGHPVTETITAGTHTADHVEPLVRTFTINSNGQTVHFVTAPNSGVTFTSSAGEWNHGTLTLTPDQARRFTVTLTPKPGHAPMKYFSMNDVLFGKKLVPLPGVNGSALPFDGKTAQHPTGVRVSDVRTNGTLALWAKPANTKNKEQTVIGAYHQTEDTIHSLSLSITGNNWEASYQSLVDKNGMGQTDFTATDHWTHLTLTFQQGHMRLYINGAINGDPIKIPLTGDINPELFIGSTGDRNFFEGLIDEVYLYDRTLSPAEIRQMYQRDRPKQEAGE